MPNVIKYSTGATPTGCLRKGNMLIGNNTADYGLTFFNGIDSPSGGYTIYLNKASGGPSIYCPANDTQLISITNQIAGTNYTTAAQCLDYFATQTDKIVVNMNYEGIVTDGLLLNLDAGFTTSYPTTGTTWYDISGNNTTGSLVNGPTYTSSYSGSIVFDGIDDYVALGTQTAWNASNALTMAAWVNISGIGGAPDIGGIITNQDTSYSSTALYAQVYGGDSSKIYITYGVTHPNPNTETYASSLENKNVWLYAVATRYFDGTNTIIKIYTNGILKQTSSMPGQQATTSNNWALGRFYGGRAMIGNLAISQVYNKELTQAEITQNYNAQKGRFGL